MTPVLPALTMANTPAADQRDVNRLFHRLNNQLGIILAHAELLQLKAGDDASRSRASQIVSSAVEAMATARELRLQVDVSATGGASR